MTDAEQSEAVADAVVVGPSVLRNWPLPEPGADKRSRGEVVIVGGAARSPGAALLAGNAALRVGAGRLTIALAASVAASAATALPECGVVPLDETAAGAVRGAAIGAASRDLASAGAVLAGPGLDDLDEAVALVDQLGSLCGSDAVVVLDAFALGALAQHPELADPFRGRLVLTPNRSEAALLLGQEGDATADDIVTLAQRFDAAVTCFSTIAADGRTWTIEAGNSGLGTSGSGDVLAGAIAGIAARGASPAQSAVWGTWVHAQAGEEAAASIGPLGFLASELLPVLPGTLASPTIL